MVHVSSVQQMDCHVVNLQTSAGCAALKFRPSTCSFPPPFLPPLRAISSSSSYCLTLSSPTLLFFCVFFFFMFCSLLRLSPPTPPTLSVLFLLSLFLPVSISTSLCHPTAPPSSRTVTRRSKLETCVTTSH